MSLPYLLMLAGLLAMAFAASRFRSRWRTTLRLVVQARGLELEREHPLSGSVVAKGTVDGARIRIDQVDRAGITHARVRIWVSNLGDVEIVIDPERAKEDRRTDLDVGDPNLDHRIRVRGREEDVVAALSDRAREALTGLVEHELHLSDECLTIAGLGLDQTAEELLSVVDRMGRVALAMTPSGSTRDRLITLVHSEGSALRRARVLGTLDRLDPDDAHTAAELLLADRGLDAIGGLNGSEDTLLAGTLLLRKQANPVHIGALRAAEWRAPHAPWLARLVREAANRMVDKAARMPTQRYQGAQSA